MTKYLSPCEYGRCPSIRMSDTLNDDPVKEAELLAACNNVLAKIIAHNALDVLIARDMGVAPNSPDNEVVFAPSPCPLMTAYSLEIIE